MHSLKINLGLVAVCAIVALAGVSAKGHRENEIHIRDTKDQYRPYNPVPHPYMP